MVSGKRLLIATLFGILCGLICISGAKIAGFEPDTPVVVSAFLNRTMIGFMIGISAIRIHYLPHGILLGFIGSIPVAIIAAFGGIAGMVGFLVFGIIWGIAIELGTTKLFKAPVPSPYGFRKAGSLQSDT